MNYEARTFDVPELDGISKKTMDEHIGLYQGYVKNFNAIKENMRALMADRSLDSPEECSVHLMPR